MTSAKEHFWANESIITDKMIMRTVIYWVAIITPKSLKTFYKQWTFEHFASYKVVKIKLNCLFCFAFHSFNFITSTLREENFPDDGNDFRTSVYSITDSYSMHLCTLHHWQLNAIKKLQLANIQCQCLLLL